MSEKEDLNKALRELQAHIKYMKKNDLPHEIIAKKKFMEIQKILEDLENE